MRPNNNSSSSSNNNNNNNRKNYGNNKNNRFRNNNTNKPSQPVRGYDGENEMVSPNQKRHAQNQQTKYNDLAKNARQAGDRVECEYYMQHADHYTRIINLADEQQRRRDGVEQPQHDDADQQDGNEAHAHANNHNHLQHDAADASEHSAAGQHRKKITRKLRAPYAKDATNHQINETDFLTNAEKEAVQVALRAEASFAKDYSLPKVKKHPNVQPQTNPHYKPQHAIAHTTAIVETTQDMPLVKKRRGRPPKAKDASENSGQLLQSVLPTAYIIE